MNTGIRWLNVRLVALLLILALVAASLPTSAQAAPPKPTQCKRSYVVRAGDTLNKIARSFGLRAVDLTRNNNMEAPYTIYVGNKLCLPDEAKRNIDDIPKKNADAIAATFTFDRTGDGIRIQVVNFPAQNYFVRAEDASTPGLSWVKLGRLLMRRQKGSAQFFITLPRELRQAEALTVCLKNNRTDVAVCRTVFGK